MNFVITAGEYGSILLGVGRITRLGGIGAAITIIIWGTFFFIGQFRKLADYKAKKRHMTKRINAVITKRERIIKEERVRLKEGIRLGKIYNYFCTIGKSGYIYTFTGLDEYEGVTFYDELLLLKNINIQGEKVSLLINEYNPEEFLFEEEKEPGKGLIIGGIVIIFLGIIHGAFIIRNWNRLPWN